MPFLAPIGIAVAGAFGVGLAATGISAMVIGGLVVGAAVGGLYSAFTGGNILKGVLYGAVGGAALGAGAYAMGFGGYGVVSTESLAGGTSVGMGENVTGAMAAAKSATEVSSVSGGTGGLIAEGGERAISAKGWFTAENYLAVGAISNLGSKFLAGGAAGDAADADRKQQNEQFYKKLEADKKMQEESLLAQREMNAAQVEAQLEGISAQERTADKNRDENARQFGLEFGESQWRDREGRAETERQRVRVNEGIHGAAAYVAGSTKVVNLVESTLKRKGLPGPSWAGSTQPGQQQPQPAPQQQVAQQTPATTSAPAPQQAPQQQSILGAA